MFRSHKTLKTGVLASLILTVGILLTSTPKAEATSYGPTGVTANIYSYQVYYSCPTHGTTWYYSSYWVTYYSNGHVEGMGDVQRVCNWIRSKGYTPQVRWSFWRTTNNG